MNPGGTVIAGAALSGGRPAYLYSSAGDLGDELLPRCRPRRHLRIVGVEAEIVEIDVAPVAGLLVDQADDDLLAHHRPQVDRDPAQIFLGQAAGAEEDFADIGPN